MSIGIWQLVIILVIILLIFGAGKLPRVMGDIGKGIKSLKKGLQLRMVNFYSMLLV